MPDAQIVKRPRDQLVYGALLVPTGMVSAFKTCSGASRFKNLQTHGTFSPDILAHGSQAGFIGRENNDDLTSVL